LNLLWANPQSYYDLVEVHAQAQVLHSYVSSGVLANESAAEQVFATAADVHQGFAFVRVYSGVLANGSTAEPVFATTADVHQVVSC
jgi:pyruvate/2-oxoacid:ferredoxin oxidoreductase beta subunit